MNALRAAASALALAAVAGCGSGTAPAPQSPPAAAAARLAGTVDRVVDGDTLVARIDGRRVRVRLLGVDAPEASRRLRLGRVLRPSSRPSRPGPCCPGGADIALRTDPTQGREDRFGRLLAEVTVRGAPRTVNEELVASGNAEVFRGDGRARLQPALRAAERRARARRLGLWGSC